MSGKGETDFFSPQFRLPSGPPVVQSFKAKEPLSAVTLWLSLHHPPADPSLSPVFSTPYPRKIFTEEDFERPLDLLGECWRVWLDFFFHLNFQILENVIFF